MKRERHYRISLWFMVLSGVILAAILTISSLKTIRAGKKFTQIILDDNKTFLINTLRFQHRMMMRMGEQNYDSLIQLALKGKFVRYVAMLDKQGGMIAQGGNPHGLLSPGEYDPNKFGDGEVLKRTRDYMVVTYRAEEVAPSTGPMGGMAGRMMGTVDYSQEPAWYLVVLDIGFFENHYHDMVIQTAGTAGAVLLLGILLIVFLGMVQRYELAHLSAERLQKIKRVLSNFVPETAKRIIEKDPDKPLLEKYVRDATVLFLDIEGFTTLVQQYPQERINQGIESYFSCFLGLIQKHEGDVNETAGDGMMVIFPDPDPKKNATDAVQAAIDLQKHCLNMAASGSAGLFPIKVNIGIGSGEVFLGSTKMRGAQGDRWTFTASGPVTILAARLSDYAQAGQILLSQETAGRLGDGFPLKPLGRVPLKNMTDSGEVYQLEIS